jgi:hypothetical protein
MISGLINTWRGPNGPSTGGQALLVSHRAFETASADNHSLTFGAINSSRSAVSANMVRVTRHHLVRAQVLNPVDRAAMIASYLDVARIPDLRPTRLAVGWREVAEKRRRWLQLPDMARREYRLSHALPTVIGPGGCRYLVGHHHLALALMIDSDAQIWVRTLADWAYLDTYAFWEVLRFNTFSHLFDAEGRRASHAAIPQSLCDLVDDPFQSLANEVRRRAGVSRATRPHADAVWADFLRLRISRERLAEDFGGAVSEGLLMASSGAACLLPGARPNTPPGPGPLIDHTWPTTPSVRRAPPRQARADIDRIGFATDRSQLFTAQDAS